MRLRSLPERFPVRSGASLGCTFGVREDPHFPELRPGPILLPESFCVSPSAPLLGGLSRADLPKPVQFFHLIKYHFEG